eukprot:4684960-Amphidinium_carterae.1
MGTADDFSWYLMTASTHPTSPTCLKGVRTPKQREITRDMYLSPNFVILQNLLSKHRGVDLDSHH